MPSSPVAHATETPLDAPSEPSATDDDSPPYWKLRAFVFGALIPDAVTTLVFLAPIWSFVQTAEGTNHTFAESLLDLSLLSVARLLACGLALLVSYAKAELPPEQPFELNHPNGDRKSREELEQEALEEPFGPWFHRILVRPSLSAEVLSVVAQILCIVKCLARMDVEIGTKQDSAPFHPIFWLAILCTALLSVAEASYLQDMCALAAQYGQDYGDEAPAIFRSISSQLLAPLLEIEEEDEEQAARVAQSTDGGSVENGVDEDNAVATSDIKSDAEYRASWRDLAMICYPDLYLLCFAFVPLLLAALAQVYIPIFLGRILDALGAAFDDDDSNHNMDMRDVPNFMKNIKLLVFASISAGVFAGLRGSIFTVVGARVNVRLRVKLMDSLLSQDIGFFDITKTGDITSRLSSDTTLVGDQVSLNVNVFLRSLVQAMGVLLFMFLLSWQLSILAFISVPLITVLSKWYGNYVRSLTRLMQQKLADGNSVSEATLGSMATVRAFDAAQRELSDFESSMSNYLQLNYKAAIAYYGYATISTSLPELVFALVVFYGGMLVRNKDMTTGNLVSFLLLMQSLSDSFATIGWVFSSLTQAVGAADKVFELMHRKPRITTPTASDEPLAQENATQSGVLGIETEKVRRQRTYGRRPESPRGEISLENVEMYYPARPKRRILNGLTLKIDPGSVVALVGQSGGGKSSIMALIQHLYEQSSGKVLFDGLDVSELSPEWISRKISTVSQEPTLFARSIKKNIMYGLEGTDVEPSDEDIIAAARLANAHDFIQRMPQGYETEVGERGVQLSGGQKQRIAIARALVRSPKVLLLDEATSALDAESEHLVQKAIDDMLLRGKGETGVGSMTVIIVAHRLSTVRSADRIFVIKEGQVVEEGSHDALIQNADGPYSSLISRQMEAQHKLDNDDGGIGMEE